MKTHWRILYESHQIIYMAFIIASLNVADAIRYDARSNLSQYENLLQYTKCTHWCVFRSLTISHFVSVFAANFAG